LATPRIAEPATLTPVSTTVPATLTVVETAVPAMERTVHPVQDRSNNSTTVIFRMGMRRSDFDARSIREVGGRSESSAMATIGWMRLRRWLGACVLGWSCAAPLVGPAWGQDAAALRARHAALREQLGNNPFQRPLYLESSQSSGNLKGEIYASIEQPYSIVGPALQGMDRWCDILILHLNVKYCQGSGAGAAETLTVVIGRKYDQPLKDAYRVDFGYQVGVANSEFLRVLLNSESGPLGTKHYRILLEAVALDAQRTFVHLSYSYAYGTAARIAMQGYLATIGRNKVGFTVAGRRADGQPVHIDGVRGVVERNTMRYYLAIEAYLGAVNLPPAERLEKRLRDWYAAIERYPVQLHELERDEYLEMKRREVKRQQAGGLSAAPRRSRRSRRELYDHRLMVRGVAV